MRLRRNGVGGHAASERGRSGSGWRGGDFRQDRRHDGPAFASVLPRNGGLERSRAANRDSVPEGAAPFIKAAPDLNPHAGKLFGCQPERRSGPFGIRARGRGGIRQSGRRAGRRNAQPDLAQVVARHGCSAVLRARCGAKPRSDDRQGHGQPTEPKASRHAHRPPRSPAATYASRQPSHDQCTRIENYRNEKVDEIRPLAGRPIRFAAKKARRLRAGPCCGREERPGNSRVLRCHPEAVRRLPRRRPRLPRPRPRSRLPTQLPPCRGAGAFAVALRSA